MVQTPCIPYFKGFDMGNLQYEIRICQKSYNKVTMTVYVMVRFFMNKTLLNNFIDIIVCFFESPILSKNTKLVQHNNLIYF